MRWTGFTLLGLLLVAAVAQGQTPSIQEAERLRIARDFTAAIRVLRDHLATHPDDGAAARMLAQTVYWTGDVTGARALYDAALARHPADQQVRLDFARMLLETGDPARARDLLTPLRAVPGLQADAHSLLGTIAYWGGDFTSAERCFSAALEFNPNHADARRQLTEIRAVSSPWLRLAPAVFHDDQPLDTRRMVVEAGWFPTPLTPIRVRVSPIQHLPGTRTIETWAVEGDVRHFAPRARVETELGIGILRRTAEGGSSSRWTGRGALGVRLPHHVKIRGHLERAPYLQTVASLETSVVATRAAMELDWAHPSGWLAQAAFQQQTFPDDNAVRARSAWLLAPLVHRRSGDVQAGYGFSHEDADDSRFVPAEGRYRPYFTPARLVKHSAIFAVTQQVGSRATVRLGSAIAIRAHDDEPALVSTSPGSDLPVARRRFTPWDVRGSLELVAGDAVTIAISADTGRGAFYEWARAGLELTYRFTTPVRPPSMAR